MSSPSVLILRAPGTNCDLESAYAFEKAGACTERVHINRLLENPKLAGEHQILCLPGGFSYGDDLGAGCILGSQIRHHLADCLAEFKAAGKLILGICNGFQILMRSGILLADEPPHGPPATLTLNAGGKYEDRWVQLGTASGNSVFLAGIESMYLPIAHAEGKFVPRDAAALNKLEAAGQLVLRYTDETVKEGQASALLPFPANPNGSTLNVAGVCDPTGRVLGLMPHPERHIDRTHHPRWTRGEGRPEGDGLALFRNAVRYFA
ncbi:MAG: phosphoribosylformylglycinamidine synthase subunit PurQ [Pirellulales bacterium]